MGDDEVYRAVATWNNNICDPEGCPNIQKLLSSRRFSAVIIVMMLEIDDDDDDEGGGKENYTQLKSKSNTNEVHLSALFVCDVNLPFF